VRTRPGPDAVHLDAGDGARAVLTVPWPPLAPGSEQDAPARLAAHAARPRTALVLLVRRGGFAVGTARDGALLDHATGTRYVQARTAAGGWSQQRYARRRRGQAAVLADAAASAALRVLHRAPGPPDVLVPGGDRLLVAEVLADPGLAAVAALPRAPLLDVPDPRLDVLTAAAGRARAVRVLVTDP
jgi:Actinobacteria/chloroflexi VLRF1 release factor